MVPKKQSGPKQTTRKSKGTKGEQRTGAEGRGEPAEVVELTPEPFIDPSLAVVIEDPHRAQIVAIAHQRPISPSEYRTISGISLGESSAHFRILRDTEYLELVERIQVRGAVKHMYRATKRAYFSAVDWGRFGESLQKGMGAAVLQDLNGRVTEALEAGTFHSRDDVVLFWQGIVLDEVTWPKFVEVLLWAISEIKELEIETVDREAKGETEESFPATFSISGFESPRSSQRRAKKARGSKDEVAGDAGSEQG